ncbi:hypothetical protein OAG24_00450 [bacterium]|nr:hypothetical protein [bacterium]
MAEKFEIAHSAVYVFNRKCGNLHDRQGEFENFDNNSRAFTPENKPERRIKFDNFNQFTRLMFDADLNLWLDMLCDEPCCANKLYSAGRFEESDEDAENGGVSWFEIRHKSYTNSCIEKCTCIEDTINVLIKSSDDVVDGCHSTSKFKIWLFPYHYYKFKSEENYNKVVDYIRTKLRLKFIEEYICEDDDKE